MQLKPSKQFKKYLVYFKYLLDFGFNRSIDDPNMPTRIHVIWVFFFYSKYTSFSLSTSIYSENKKTRNIKFSENVTFVKFYHENLKKLKTFC
jgi:hypothetical protein